MSETPDQKIDRLERENAALRSTAEPDQLTAEQFKAMGVADRVRAVRDGRAKDIMKNGDPARQRHNNNG